MRTHAVVCAKIYNRSRAHPVFFVESWHCINVRVRRRIIEKVGDVRLLRLVSEREESISLDPTKRAGNYLHSVSMAYAYLGFNVSHPLLSSASPYYQLDVWPS